jgi:hypothetical protein
MDQPFVKAPEDCRRTDTEKVAKTENESPFDASLVTMGEVLNGVTISEVPPDWLINITGHLNG